MEGKVTWNKFINKNEGELNRELNLSVCDFFLQFATAMTG